MQRYNFGEIFGATSDGGQNLSHPGWNRVKVSENLGATAVTPVAPVDTSLDSHHDIRKVTKITRNYLERCPLVDISKLNVYLQVS